jgi:ribosomal protein S18 acetylase RimI-like enzyme
LLAPWRHRPEITYVEELDAGRSCEVLLRAAFERCVLHGDALMLAIELELSRRRSRFERAGLELLEEVITYEIDAWRAPNLARGELAATPVTAGDERAIAHLLRIDEAAFPWLWRNNRTEFDIYLRTSGVAVSLLYRGESPVAYVGATMFAGWGHLDRIAVLPGAQGRGYGRQALTLAIDGLRRRGAQRIALSTQETNRRSQRLYERFGFARTPELDYRLFGAWCRGEAEGGRREADGGRWSAVHPVPTADMVPDPTRLPPSAVRRPPSGR